MSGLFYDNYLLDSINGEVFQFIRVQLLILYNVIFIMNKVNNLDCIGFNIEYLNVKMLDFNRFLISQNFI